MFFLPLPLVLIEVLIFTTWMHFYDFWDVFFAYMIPSFVGALMLASFGRNLMVTLQTSLVPGQMPGNAVLHQAARLAGALALIVPLFLTRVLAVFLIVPGLRHLSILFFKKVLFKKLARNGGFSFVNFGGGAWPGGGGPGFGGGPWPGGGGPETGYGEDSSRPRERDATVVDVTPIQVTHQQKKD
jgi:UPF0716 protein FxsA